jgi:hypothetical protein
MEEEFSVSRRTIEKSERSSFSSGLPYKLGDLKRKERGRPTIPTS